jgi:hypothetical protein
MGVRKVRESPAARNQGGGWISPAAASGSIPAMARTEVEVEDIRHEKLPGGAAKLLRPWPGLGCSETAGPRWGRELGAAEQGRGGARASGRRLRWG